MCYTPEGRYTLIEGRRFLALALTSLTNTASIPSSFHISGTWKDPFFLSLYHLSLCFVRNWKKYINYIFIRFIVLCLSNTTKVSFGALQKGILHGSKLVYLSHWLYIYNFFYCFCLFSFELVLLFLYIIFVK